MTPSTGRLSKVICPATDLTALVAFYGDVMGIGLKFRDGDRYAEFEKQEVSLALAAGEEAVAASAVVIAFAVPDLDASLAAALVAGGRVVVPPEQGPHEVRAVLEDPSGNSLVLYQKTS